MALPLLGYFACMVAVLTAVVGVMIGFFDTSTSERVHHYPRPVLEHSRPLPERNNTAPNSEPRLFMSVPNAKDASPAKNVDANSVAAADEKSDAKKSKPHKRKVFARQRNNNYGYWNAPGYADAYRNGPQRPFSNW